MYDETHVTTIAVDLPYRGRGSGELLLISAFAEAIGRGSAWLSLEVRVTNHAAQGLYEKYGMTVYGRRAAYYTDNSEDALVMWSRSLRDRNISSKSANCGMPSPAIAGDRMCLNSDAAQARPPVITRTLPSANEDSGNRNFM